MTKKQINNAIKHTGLEVAGKRGDGCYYFVDIETNSTIDGCESIYIGSMKHFKKSQWVEEAEEAAKIRDERAYIKYIRPAVIILR